MNSKNQDKMDDKRILQQQPNRQVRQLKDYSMGESSFWLNTADQSMMNLRTPMRSDYYTPQMNSLIHTSRKSPSVFRHDIDSQNQGESLGMKKTKRKGVARKPKKRLV